MAITQAFCNQAKLDFFNAKITGSDTFKIALYTSAASLDATTTAYSATNEVVGLGYAAGGFTLTGFSASLTSGVANITFNNVTVATSSITARGALIYDTTVSNRAIAVLDFGIDYISTSGSFTINMPAAGTTAIIRIA